MPTSARTEGFDVGSVEEALGRLLGRKRYVRVGGLHGGSAGLLLARLATQVPALLVVVSDPRAAEAAALDLETFLGRPPLSFPAWPHEDPSAPPDAETLSARVQVLSASVDAARGEDWPLVVVAPLLALSQAVPSPDVIAAATLTIRTGQEHPPEGLLERLAIAGYARVGAVESAGDFASRGGVVDVFPFGAERPLRLDFLGDLVESTRELDPGTQRSGAERGALRFLAITPERIRRPVERTEVSLLLDHLPDGGWTVLLDPHAVSARTALVRAEDPTVRSNLRRLDAALAKARRIDVSPLPFGREADLDVDVGTIDELRGVVVRAEQPGRPLPSPRRADPAAVVRATFAHVGSRADRVVVVRRALGEEERLRELLGAGGASGSPVEYVQGSLSRSFLFGPTRTAYVAYDDLVDLPARERRAVRTLPPSRPIQDFLELEAGAYVVHLHHGIGLFRGLVTDKGPDGQPVQSLKVEFSEGTTLFVPVSRIDLVQRYIGTGRRPRLSKVGGTEWSARKAKVAAAVSALAVDLLAVQALRHRRQGPPSLPHPEWQREFEDAFPYEDTADQASATVAVKGDLASQRPMDRLLCGDVGYGKTEVALRAIFQVAAAGRQVAVLVPTTVLAEQHLRTFASRLGPYPLEMRALSRFRTGEEQKEILAGLADGSVDVVVGTHRLFSKDVKFHDLGLVVVDEEQRFGVEHKERLKELRAGVDVLTLSATPIPRTLHMALLGLRDISNLTTPPAGRHPIETKVARADDALIREVLRRELDRGGQAFFVHNRVMDLPEVAARVSAAVPDARVAVIHGQMDRDHVEDRMIGFVRGEIDVLVTTTIVESGLDIPNANTIVLHNADRFGLAELHQLRGRVGRERRRAHCLLLVPPDRVVSSEAADRLRALEEYTELGAGFRIAMRDLELRGAGNLLGAQQSGHIAAVGYELYCRLLGEAVERATKDAPRHVEPATLEVDLPAGIPDTYVRDARETFRLFRRISTAPTVEVLDALRSEVADRFGPPPPSLERLLLAQGVRVAAGAMGVARVVPAEEGGIVLEAAPDSRAFDRLEGNGLALRRLDGMRAYVPPARSVDATLRRVLDACRAPPN